MPSPGRFDSRARVLRERVHSESIEVRHIISRDKRELSVDSAQDGMAGLTAHLPAASVQAIYNREADVAAGLHSPDEPRTLFRLREDVFCVLLIDGVTAESHPTHPNLGTLTVSACSSRCRCGALPRSRPLRHISRAPRLVSHAGWDLPGPGMRCRRSVLRSRPDEGLAVPRSLEPRQSRAPLPETPRPEAAHRVDRRAYRRGWPRMGLAYWSPVRDRARNPDGRHTADRAPASKRWA